MALRVGIRGCSLYTEKGHETCGKTDREARASPSGTRKPTLQCLLVFHFKSEFSTFLLFASDSENCMFYAFSIKIYGSVKLTLRNTVKEVSQRRKCDVFTNTCTIALPLIMKNFKSLNIQQ